MKKILLLAAAAMMAASASAEVFPQAAAIGEDDVDITPAAYKFNTYDKGFIGYTCAQVLNWNMTVNWYRDNYVATEKEFGDGLVIPSGPLYNGNAENIAKLTDASKIVDLGGSCGKVFVLNFSGSQFPAAYKKVTGQDLEIGEATGYPLLFWHFNHNDLMDYVGQVKDGADYMPLRIRMEVNMFANEQSSTGEYWKAYMNDDQNNVRPAGKGDNGAADILVNPSEFAYRWCEKSDDPEDANDDSVYDEENAKGTWNPNRWLVYEWDVNVAAPETEDEVFKSTIRIKNEIPGGNAGNFTVLIRNINLYVPATEGREYIFAARPRTWNFYTTGEPASVESVAVEADALTYTVNGEAVTFSAAAKVYNMAGAMVAEGTTVTLAHGVYVAQAGGKTVKLAVK